MSAPGNPVATVPTGAPSRVLQVHLAEGGYLYVGEYESRRPGKPHTPTVRAVQLPAAEIPALRRALEAAEAEARRRGWIPTNEGER